MADEEQVAPESSPPRLRAEPTTFSPGLIGFYACCCLVGIGAAAAAIVLIVFPDAAFTWPIAIIGVILVVVCSVASLRLLKLARHEV